MTGAESCRSEMRMTGTERALLRARIIGDRPRVANWRLLITHA
jgi:hypothetical protein